MTPKSENELAEIIRAANAPVSICGGGTRPIGHSVEGEPISTSALSGIELYEPGALTIVVQAGTSVAEVETALRSEGQRLAFEPMDHRRLLATTGEPTMGGIVAANVSGPRRIQVGAARDFMLGVRFVDGRGQILKNGGRVMKNVTGYDLVKLMTGSYGTLGVVTELSLKVLPVPETEASLLLHGLEIERAISAMSAALGSPYEVTGAAHFPEASREKASTVMRIEGFESSVDYRLGELKALLGRYGEMSELRGSESATAWMKIRDVEQFADSDGDVWRISVKPTDTPDLTQQLGDDVRVFLDWGGGLVWALAPDGTDLRTRLGSFDGHATLIRASEATRSMVPVFHPEPLPIQMITEGLRNKFDPKGILNSGLMRRPA